MNASMAPKRFLPVFLACIYFLPGFISPAHAEPETLKQRVREEMRRLFDEGKISNKDACGGYARVDSQRTTTTPNGATTQVLPKGWDYKWGCNASQEGGEQPATHSTIAEDEKDGDTEIETRATVTLFWNYDNDKESVTLKGRVVDSDGKPKKGAVIEVRNKYSYLGGNNETKTDANGEYEVRTTSGDYNITASGDGCSKTEAKRMCGFGEATAPPPGAPHRHAPYTQDFKLECGNWALQAKGTRVINFGGHDEVETITGSGHGTMEGCIPVRVEPKTGAISGEGIINSVTENMAMQVIGQTWGNGGGTATPVPVSFKLSGQAANGNASFVLECQRSGATHISAGVTLCDEDGCGSGHGGVSSAGENCSGQPVSFSLPLQEGAIHHDHQDWAYSEGEENVNVSSDTDFTLVQKESCPDSAPPGNNESGGDAPLAAPSAVGQQGGSGGVASGAKTFVYPFNGATQTDESSTGGADTIQQVMDMVQEAAGSQGSDASDYTDNR